MCCISLIDVEGEQGKKWFVPNTIQFVCICVFVWMCLSCSFTQPDDWTITIKLHTSTNKQSFPNLHFPMYLSLELQQVSSNSIPASLRSFLILSFWDIYWSQRRDTSLRAWAVRLKDSISNNYTTLLRMLTHIQTSDSLVTCVLILLALSFPFIWFQTSELTPTSPIFSVIQMK